LFLHERLWISYLLICPVIQSGVEIKSRNQTGILPWIESTDTYCSSKHTGRRSHFQTGITRNHQHAKKLIKYAQVSNVEA
jgi:hypothetical protein